MNPESLLTFSQYVENTISTFADVRSFAFGASVCQRVVPILYDELKRTHTQKDVDELEHHWELIWEMLADLRDRPKEDLISFFGALVPPPDEAEDHQDYFQAANMLYGFVVSLESSSASDMLYVSDASLALLDNYLHRTLSLKPSTEADAEIFFHPVVKAEMQRQVRDLEDVKFGTVQEATIRLWQRSRHEFALESK
jgi:hypothetical protein